MRQQTLAEAVDGSFEKYHKPTRRELFLAEMDGSYPGHGWWRWSSHSTRKLATDAQ